ncbi:MAG: alkaline phosphatase D family protein [Verrucomicrobia bacterium]|nr:alkaline phosphatase D family protein [Verrucomicrobiota bacterium]
MSNFGKPLSRRKFIAHSASLAAGSVVAANLAPIFQASAAQPAPEFRSAWEKIHDRVWLGAEYWANPLHDWQLANGRIQLSFAGPDRNVHLLTRQLGEAKGTFNTSVRIGRSGDKALAGEGSFGFRVGIMGPLREYRNSLFNGGGLNCGVTGDGGLFIGNINDSEPGAINLNNESIELRLTAEPVTDKYKLQLSALDAKTGKLLGQIERNDIQSNQLVGNIALVCNYGSQAKANAKKNENSGIGQFWFADWRVSGSKVEAHENHAFGPILFSSYTLSHGVMKMTAQMPPIGDRDSQTVRLQIRKGSNWTTLAMEKIHSQARTATFRIAKWNDKKDEPFRLAYTMQSRHGKPSESYWTGTIRRNPVDKPELTVADISCNYHTAFPNALYVANTAKLDPDILAFVGDQFYEASAGYGVTRAPLNRAINDYLRKWYCHGWTWRELMRDRPSLALPDDHDVYQGNIWGEGGEGRKTTQAAGGYDQPVEWVNVVHRSQTAHHPDPYDPRPSKRGTSNYYGAMLYGGVSFAVLADRQYKSGPEGKVPPTDSTRGDHVLDLDYDPKSADLPGLELLGAKQMQFLREWVTDWKGAEMKAVISQTIFSGMATIHGNNQQLIRIDYDANGWPQTPRNEALKIIRKAFAVHISGDQHLPAVVHYGIDEHRDGPIAFAGPAVNVGYPRWWEPQKAKWTGAKPGSGLTGDFTDTFGHPMTVLAVKNGAYQPRKTHVLETMHDKASGLGLVRFDKKARRISLECWPYLADPTKPDTQFPGWPVQFHMLENYARKPLAHLPLLKISGIKNPVVQVIEEQTGELVYALRLNESSWQPHVFNPASRYTIKVSEPETGKEKVITGIVSGEDKSASINVAV